MANTESETQLGEAEIPPSPETERVGHEANETVTAVAAPASEASNVAPRSVERSVRRPSSAHASSAASGDRSLEAYEALTRSARLPDLIAITQMIVRDAAAHRSQDWSFAVKVGAAAEDAHLPRSEADTPFGNALKVLESGPEDAAERALAGALWAHAIAESRRDDDDRMARDVLWLGTHTAFDATPLLDRALGEDADELWEAVAERVKRVLDGRGESLGRGEAIVGAAALSASSSARAHELASDLARTTTDPVLRSILGNAASPTLEGDLSGEAQRAPRGVVATTILALTGLLFVIHAVRWIAKIAFAYRSPAKVTLTSEGIRMHTRVELLGRTVNERDLVIPFSNLASVSREVRYPRAGFYAGLLALAVGSLIGVRTFVDGIRSASPSLLAVGVAIVALGIAADFVFGSLLPGTQGFCRIAFVPRTGRTLCVGEVDHARADTVLTSLARRTR